MDVTTETCGSQALVASYRPPRPTSSTATVQPSAAKCATASAVVSSNVVGRPTSLGSGTGTPIRARRAATRAATAKALTGSRLSRVPPVQRDGRAQCLPVVVQHDVLVRRVRAGIRVAHAERDVRERSFAADLPHRRRSAGRWDEHRRLADLL